MRLAKLLKLLRIFRVFKAFRELRIMLTTIFGSLKSMIWCMVLTLAITFVFGVAFLQGVTSFLQDLRKSPDGVFLVDSALLEQQLKQDLDVQKLEALLQHFGSVTRSMQALYFAATSGESWAYQASPLWYAGWQYYGLFLFYIGFCLFVVMNSLTALFVDGVFEQSEKDHHMIVQEMLNKRSSFTEKLLTLFKELDADLSGEVSHEEFCGHLADPRLRAFAESLELEVNDLEQFFSILSNGGRNEVDMESFVIGCIKLRGNAKSIDLMDLMTSQRFVNGEIGRFMQQCAMEFTSLRIAVDFSQTKLSQLLVLSEQAAPFELQPRSMARGSQTKHEGNNTSRVLGASRGSMRVSTSKLPSRAPQPSWPLYRNLVDEIDHGDLGKVSAASHGNGSDVCTAAPHLSGHSADHIELSSYEASRAPCCVLRAA